MKKILFISVIIASSIHTEFAQIANPKKKAKQSAENRVNTRIDEGINRGLDRIEEGVDGIFRKREKENTENNPKGIENNPPSQGKTVKSANSDFVPGGKVLFYDDFSQDALGDFPARWNTNGSGSVVTIDGLQGRWFSVIHNSVVNPLLDQKMPENATIEFDLFLSYDGHQSTPFIQFGLTPVRDILREDIFYSNRFFINLHRYWEADGKTLEYGIRNDVIGNKNDFPTTRYTNKILHVAIALNKTRIRLYLEGTKVIDLPKVLSNDMFNTFFLNNNYLVPASETPMYIANVRIASADVDARSMLVKQLMEEGNVVTNEILFDVNSDVIKSQSYPIINQIGEALVNNPTLKIKIIGHTDSDGSESDNLLLSKNRAKSVKEYITEHYAVAGSRIQTDGKGESQPVADNNSNDGKAKNRRVEFTKL